MLEIGLELRVEACDQRHAHPLRQGLRSCSENVGGGDVNDIGREPTDVAADGFGKSERQAELAAHGQLDRWHGHEFALGSNAGVSVTGE